MHVQNSHKTHLRYFAVVVVVVVTAVVVLVVVVVVVEGARHADVPGRFERTYENQQLPIDPPFRHNVFHEQTMKFKEL